MATEVLYHLKAKELGYKPQVMRVGDKTHWYLRKGGDVIDITKEQFPFELDHSLGRGCGFLTKEPSQRTKIYMYFMKQLEDIRKK